MANVGRFFGLLPLYRRHRHRYGRLHSPACRLYRHSGLEADLWPMLALGYCCFCLIARPSRADYPYGARRGDDAGMASFDKRDTTSVERDVPDYEAVLTGDIKGLRVGIPQEYRVDNMPAEIEKLWQQGIDWLKAAGAEIVDVLPHTKYALPAYYIMPKRPLIWRAMTACAMERGKTASILTICMRKPALPVSVMR